MKRPLLPHMLVLALSTLGFAQEEEKSAPAEVVSTTSKEPTPYVAPDPTTAFSKALERVRGLTSTEWAAEFGGTSDVAQTEADALLIEAMKTSYRFSSEALMKKDYKTYFSSDEFISDYSDGKWSLGVEAVIEGVPFKLAGDSSLEQLREFQKKVRAASAFDLSSRIKYEIAETILDPEVFEKYVALIRARNQRLGFQCLVTTSGANVTFTLSYKTDIMKSGWPKIRKLRIDDGILLDKDNFVGRTMDAPITVTARRIGDEDVFLTLETNLGSITERAAIAESVRRAQGIPIGTIIASALPPDAFLKAVGEKGDFSSPRVTWAPADGRAVGSNEYQRLTLRSNLPDLRGVFLRGLNTMDSKNTLPIPDGHADPETRDVLHFQPDLVGPHAHSLILEKRWGGATSREFANAVAPGFGADDGSAGSAAASTQVAGALESRPKNIAVYYYIKIR